MTHDDNQEIPPLPDARVRVTTFLDADIMAWVKLESDKMRSNESAFIRLALTRQMNREKQND